MFIKYMDHLIRPCCSPDGGAFSSSKKWKEGVKLFSTPLSIITDPKIACQTVLIARWMVKKTEMKEGKSRKERMIPEEEQKAEDAQSC